METLISTAVAQKPGPVTVVNLNHEFATNIRLSQSQFLGALYFERSICVRGSFKCRFPDAYDLPSSHAAPRLHSHPGHLMPVIPICV